LGVITCTSSLLHATIAKAATKGSIFFKIAVLISMLVFSTAKIRNFSDVTKKSVGFLVPQAVKNGEPWKEQQA
jgi:hypothetical protein